MFSDCFFVNHRTSNNGCCTENITETVFTDDNNIEESSVDVETEMTEMLESTITIEVGK
jgi:hypothetical protein